MARWIATGAALVLMGVATAGAQTPTPTTPTTPATPPSAPATPPALQAALDTKTKAAAAVEAAQQQLAVAQQADQQAGHALRQLFKGRDALFSLGGDGSAWVFLAEGDRGMIRTIHALPAGAAAPGGGTSPATPAGAGAALLPTSQTRYHSP